MKVDDQMKSRRCSSVAGLSLQHTCNLNAFPSSTLAFLSDVIDVASQAVISDLAALVHRLAVFGFDLNPAAAPALQVCCQETWAL